MSRWIAPRAEIVDGANQPFAEVMLPDAVHDDPRDERTGAMIDIGHPLDQGAPLLRGIWTAAVGACPSPIVRWRFAANERGQESQLDWLALRAEVATGEQECLARFRAEIGKGERRGQRLRLGNFNGFDRPFAFVP